MTSFERQVFIVLKRIRDTLDEIRDELPWPSSEHVGYRLDEVNSELAELEDLK